MRAEEVIEALENKTITSKHETYYVRVPYTVHADVLNLLHEQTEELKRLRERIVTLQVAQEMPTNDLLRYYSKEEVANFVNREMERQLAHGLRAKGIMEVHENSFTRGNEKTGVFQDITRWTGKIKVLLPDKYPQCGVKILREVAP